MDIFKFFGVCMCIVLIYAQEAERPARVLEEIPETTRRPHLHRVAQGTPRVRVIPGANEEEGNEDTPMVTARSRGQNLEPNITLSTNDKPARVTENPSELTTVTKEHCPGCPIEIHHNDSNIQKYARNASDIYKARKEIPRNAKIERIYDVKRQVINGIRYDFKMVFSYSVAASNIKNMATCEVEVLLHHTKPRPQINAKPCKKPRTRAESDGPVEEELGNSGLGVPRNLTRQWN